MIHDLLHSSVKIAPLDRSRGGAALGLLDGIRASRRRGSMRHRRRPEAAPRSRRGTHGSSPGAVRRGRRAAAGRIEAISRGSAPDDELLAVARSVSADPSLAVRASLALDPLLSREDPATRLELPSRRRRLRSRSATPRLRSEPSPHEAGRRVRGWVETSKGRPRAGGRLGGERGGEARRASLMRSLRESSGPPARGGAPALPRGQRSRQRRAIGSRRRRRSPRSERSTGTPAPFGGRWSLARRRRPGRGCSCWGLARLLREQGSLDEAHDSAKGALRPRVRWRIMPEGWLVSAPR